MGEGNMRTLRQPASISFALAGRFLRMSRALASALPHVRPRAARRGCLALPVLMAGLFVSHNVIAGESFDDSAKAAHAMLTELCDDFGGRLTGSPANRGAMEQLATKLGAL